MKKFLMSLVVAVVAMSSFLMPMNERVVYADEEDDSAEVEEETGESTKQGAVILSDCWSEAETDGKEGIVCVLKIGVDILTVLVGVLGVIGIVVVGIQYLTAGGNEGQVTKAKQRMLEIVIGLVLYAVIYALLNWLLPTFG